MQSVDSIETYAYGASKVIVSKKEEIRCSNSIKRYKMINFDDVTNENIKKKMQIGLKFMTIHTEI